MVSHLPLELPMNGSQLLEASAGTGKTYTITNLCLRLLLGRNVPWKRPLAISEILILTFTIAATDELKDRVFRRINDAREAFRSGTTDEYLQTLIDTSSNRDRELKLLTAASQLMDDASIFTIHGFAARVLGEQAFESGTLFNQDLNAERRDLLRSAAQDCFRELIMPMPGTVRQLAISQWASPDIMAQKMTPLLFRGELLLVPGEESEVTGDSLVRDIGLCKKTWLTSEMPALLEDIGVNKQRKAYKHLGKMQAFCESEEIDLDNDLWLTYGHESIGSSLKKGHDFPGHPVIDQITKVTQDIAQLRVNLWHRTMSYIQARMAYQKETRQQMTLDDLLVSLDNALTKQNSSLPQTLARRWPIALIDEFQDTDNVQSRIFNTIYQQPASGDLANLVMIGDPKQAIYNFRGADIYTYINARRSSSGLHSLSTNWRSSHALIHATNALFDKKDIFGSSGDIDFIPVQGAPGHEDMAMTKSETTCAPYEIAIASAPKGAGGISVVRKQLMDWAANEAASLINTDLDARIKGNPIHAGQIAILVRRRSDAIAAQASLTERGIQSVYLTLESVFLQDTASDLKLILEAILEPGNDRVIRAALATGLLQGTAEDIERLNHDVHFQQRVTLEFQGYHQLWNEQNIATMLNKLIEQRRLAEKWLKQSGGERQMTNLRHLTEVLQKRATVAPGMYQLIKWFAQEQIDAETVSDEQRQLRLESDQNLVKIVTMHAAKGLEYDIVMIPMPLFPDMTRKNDPALFHLEREGAFIPAVELGANPDHREISRREEKDEEMRLLYVALTRARYRCYLGLPAMKTLPHSGIGRLLGIHEEILEAKVLEDQLKQTLEADLFSISSLSKIDKISVKTLTKISTLTPPLQRSNPKDNWRVHSYTSLASRLNATATVNIGKSDAGHSIRGFSDDDSSELGPGLNSATESQINRHDFPRGARIGIALHSLMEHIDFRDSSLHQVNVDKLTKRLGLGDEWHPEIHAWLSDILSAQLGDHRLQSIEAVNRMDEMEFHFPVSSRDQLIKTLEALGLVEPGSRQQISLEGIMTGMIDLVFRKEGRYSIVDYKSNHLGNNAAAYHAGSLGAAMDEHRYHLQYLIYTVALHRLLKLRVPDYRYEQHFEGVHYFFMRGALAGSDNGIFTVKPDKAVVEALDSALGGNL
ncbi:MAG: exodeoxyribonuclease V beta subunit [Candidatus Azotimanducaceae bacterium]|jgi:exodeoxyribonuclease V beta subunit